jgi:hypothetical protein
MSQTKQHNTVNAEFLEDYLIYKAGNTYEIKEPVFKKLNDKKIVKRKK